MQMSQILITLWYGNCAEMPLYCDGETECMLFKWAMSTGTINYTHRGYIVVELNQQMNTIYIYIAERWYKRHSVGFCIEFLQWKRNPVNWAWVYTLNSLHGMAWERWWNFCVPLLSNDPDQMTISEQQMRNFDERKKTRTKYYDFETGTRRLCARKLQRVLFIYILPLSFGLFPTKREKNWLGAPYHICDNVIFGSYPIFEFSFSMQRLNSKCSTQNCNLFFIVFSLVFFFVAQ